MSLFLSFTGQYLKEICSLLPPGVLGTILTTEKIRFEIVIRFLNLSNVITVFNYVKRTNRSSILEVRPNCAEKKNEKKSKLHKVKVKIGRRLSKYFLASRHPRNGKIFGINYRFLQICSFSPRKTIRCYASRVLRKKPLYFASRSTHSTSVPYFTFACCMHS